MFKTLSAALIAASVVLAPMASVTANAAQPATKTVTTKQVKMVKKHKRHAMTHHKRGKFAKHTRYKNHGLKVRHGKIVKAHKRASIVAPKVRAN